MGGRRAALLVVEAEASVKGDLPGDWERGR